MNNDERRKQNNGAHRHFTVCVWVWGGACGCVVWTSTFSSDNEDRELMELDLEFLFSVSVAKVTTERHKWSDVAWRGWKRVRVS